MKTNVGIVIPYYHIDLNELETVSWKQALKIFANRKVILVVPDDMPEEDYPEEPDLLYEVVPSVWMQSVSTYNRMMLDKNFYKRFCAYEYILIYQLDAFVFRDELDRFCAYGYDYIGAPWLGGSRYFKNFEQCVWYVGNGGLSLRKVQAALNILEIEDTSAFDLPEDVFWASCDGEKFQVAPVELALQFSFETNVRKCYQLNGEQLPFGCHAWERYDFEFWKTYIEAEGYRIIHNIAGGMDKIILMPDLRFMNLRKEDIRDCGDEFFGWNGKLVLIWGAGELGKECGWLLKRAGIEEYIYIDKDKTRQGTTLWNQSIVQWTDIELREINTFICIIAVNKEREEILNQLEKKGYLYGEDVFFYQVWREKLKEMVREKNREYFVSKDTV